jgi:APA family basic amino acid/polyamine antiporter
MHKRPLKRHLKKRGLKKDLGLFELTLYGIGIILGAGIYAIIGEGAAIAGNGIWLSFIIAAIIAAFTGLSYAELSSIYPKEAAEYNYTKNAFQREWLGFLIGWIMVLAGIISAAAVALAFGGYFAFMFATPILPVAIGIILLFSVLNFIGIKESAWFNIISTIVEATGLIIIIILGLNYIGAPGVNYFDIPGGPQSLVSAAALIFFAFIGFQDVANISEEVKNAAKNVPKALIISLVVSTVLYILVTVSAVSILGWEALAASKAPLTEVAVAAAGDWILPVLSTIALFATGNTVLIILIVASRILYGMASGGSIPKIFSKVHKGRGTPYFAIFFVMLIAALFTMVGDLGFVANLTNVGIFIGYFFVNTSLIMLRIKQPRLRGRFRAPINIGNFPVLATLGSVTCFAMFFYFDPVILVGELAVICLGYGLFLMHKRTFFDRLIFWKRRFPIDQSKTIKKT